MKAVVVFLGTALLAALVALPTIALTPSEFGDQSAPIVQAWFESPDPLATYVLLAYMTHDDMANPNLVLRTHCDHPTKGMIPNFPDHTPKNPSYDEIWELIKQPTNYNTVPYDNPTTFPEDYGAAWSNHCYVARFLQQPSKRFAAHYEQLLAAWMYHEMIPLQYPNQLAIYGSRKPCDFGEQSDETVRYCSDVIRESFRMRQNKQQGDLSGASLYINRLDDDYFLIFDWTSETTILQNFGDAYKLSEFMHDFVIAPVAVVGGSHPNPANCVFPFTYNGRSYSTCTFVDHDAPWCSTTAVYNGQWGECSASRTKGIVEAKLPTRSENCVFPFDYENKLYYDCSYDPDVSEQPWCVTNIMSGDWGYCVTRNRVNATTTAGDAVFCAFPFKYNGEDYFSCTTVDNGDRFWCATTHDYDVDQAWGNCY